MKNALNRKASFVLVGGKSGTGKTTYLERYIVGSHHQRVFIFDHQGELGERLGIQASMTLASAYEQSAKNRFIAYDFSDEAPADKEGAFEAFATYVFEFAKLNAPRGVETLFVCDEVQQLLTQWEIPTPLKAILETGRRRRLDGLFGMQQFNAVHNVMRNQVTEIVALTQTDETALKFLDSQGFDPEQVRSLPQLHYVWKKCITGEFREGQIKY